MNDVLVPIDRAGRVVLPKAVRQELAIQPGDVLRVSVQGLTVTLAVNQDKTGLVRRGKALVFETAGSEALGSEAVRDLLEGERQEHHRRVVGKGFGGGAGR
jgi:AbrB family looped-hinge helix DNA binding protein